jgi:hypothetical protein
MKEITITDLIGTQPYTVYICDNTYNMCAYVTTINDADIPYSFLVPEPYNNLSEVGIRVLDGNNCVIKSLIVI